MGQNKTLSSYISKSKAATLSSANILLAQALLADIKVSPYEFSSINDFINNIATTGYMSDR